MMRRMAIWAAVIILGVLGLVMAGTWAKQKYDLRQREVAEQKYVQLMQNYRDRLFTKPIDLPPGVIDRESTYSFLDMSNGNSSRGSLGFQTELYGELDISKMSREGLNEQLETRIAQIVEYITVQLAQRCPDAEITFYFNGPGPCLNPVGSTMAMANIHFDDGHLTVCGYVPMKDGKIVVPDKVRWVIYGEFGKDIPSSCPIRDNWRD